MALANIAEKLLEEPVSPAQRTVRQGTGLYGAICIELGEPERARSYFEQLEARGIDLRLAYQPAFLEELAAVNLWSGSMQPAGSAGDCPDLAGLVQKAAKLACMGVSTGISRRLHGAVLFSGCRDGYEVLAEGFNHLAEPLQARRPGSPHKLRAVQRHAEVAQKFCTSNGCRSV